MSGFPHKVRAGSIASIFLFLVSAAGQSTLADHPTPITSNSISGSIPSRDLGDARLTTHYFWFEGGQGDLFINLVAKNLSGDIDVFIQNGMRPITKIVVYPDFGEVETGRVIYLRKPERLLLRVQGRTPNDEPAEYRFKFAGSFIAASGGSSEIELPKVTAETTGPVRVNSVGTILPPAAKPVETPAPAAEEKTVEGKVADQTETVRPVAAKAEPEKPSEEKKFEVVVTDPTTTAEKKPETAASNARRTRNRRTRNNTSGDPVKTDGAKTAESKSDVKKAADSDREPEEDAKTVVEGERKAEERSAPVDPLANVQLVIEFKDGSKIERPLSEVQRFSVDKGVLTVVNKNGRTGKYSMIDVTKVTIQ